MLKEKGFGLDDDNYIQLSRWYDKNGEYFENHVCVRKKYKASPNHLGANTIDDFEANLSFIDNSLEELHLAPTIAEVVMWLYEKHGIWIRVTPIPYSKHLTHWRWEHMSTNYATRNLRWKKEKDYISPTEAYEAAILYTLNNLI